MIPVVIQLTRFLSRRALLYRVSTILPYISLIFIIHLSTTSPYLEEEQAEEHSKEYEILGLVGLASPASTPTISTATSNTANNVTPVQPPPILIPNPGIDIPAVPPTGCRNWNGLDSCPSDNVYTFPNISESRRWQTPPKGAADYEPAFQNYRDLIGYADIQYNAARTAASVIVNAASRTGETLIYSFNGANQNCNVFHVTNAFADGLNIVVTTSSGKKLALDTLYFTWQANIVTLPSDTTFNNGQKGAIVELFGWPYADITQECVFLAKAGYMGVKIWPPTESIWGSSYYEEDKQFRPWYLTYVLASHVPFT